MSELKQVGARRLHFVAYPVAFALYVALFLSWVGVHIVQIFFPHSKSGAEISMCVVITLSSFAGGMAAAWGRHSITNGFDIRTRCVEYGLAAGYTWYIGSVCVLRYLLPLPWHAIYFGLPIVSLAGAFGKRWSRLSRINNIAHLRISEEGQPTELESTGCTDGCQRLSELKQVDARRIGFASCPVSLGFVAALFVMLVGAHVLRMFSSYSLSGAVASVHLVIALSSLAGGTVAAWSRHSITKGFDIRPRCAEYGLAVGYAWYVVMICVLWRLLLLAWYPVFFDILIVSLSGLLGKRWSRRV